MSEEFNELKMVKIMTSSSEKVGLKNYSSVDIGPISVTRFVEEGTDEEIAAQIKRNLRMVEDIISEVREEVLNELHASKENAGY